MDEKGSRPISSTYWPVVRSTTKVANHSNEINSSGGDEADLRTLCQCQTIDQTRIHHFGHFCVNGNQLRNEMKGRTLVSEQEGWPMFFHGTKHTWADQFMIFKDSLWVNWFQNKRQMLTLPRKVIASPDSFVEINLNSEFGKLLDHCLQSEHMQFCREPSCRRWQSSPHCNCGHLPICHLHLAQIHQWHVLPLGCKSNIYIN